MKKIPARLEKINTHILAYATVLVAFFLRVYRLADKNVWWDEGWSLWLARQDFVAIALRTAADEHPPLHYWMLHVWNAVAGGGAYAGRFLSVAFGVLTIALMYRIAKRAGGAWIGALAALFLATARFHIWWSQDIKNYTPSIFFAFAAVWFGLQIISDLSVRNSQASLRNSIFAYALCAALAMLTHYLAVLVLLAVNIYALIILVRSFRVSGLTLRILLRHPPTVLRPWILANLLAAALFAPWLALYLQNAQAWSAAPPFDFGLFLKLVATVLPLGVTTNIENYAGVTIAFTTIAVLGGMTVIGHRILKTDYALLFTLIVLLPPFLIYALSLTSVSFFAPKIQARYLLILFPAYAMLVALGIALLSRFSRALAFFALLFVLASDALVLRDYYGERRLHDEYTTLANTINAFARQGDLILLNTDQEWPTFLYYLRAPLEWMGAPNGKTMIESDADWLVRRAVNRSSAIWLVAIPDALATDPQRILEARLARDWQKQFEQIYGDKRVALYAPAPRDLVQVVHANLNIQHPLPFIPFGNIADPSGYQAHLIGFDLPVREVRAGDTIYVTTYWFAVATRGEMQLVDTSGRSVNSAPLDLATGKDVRVVTALNVPPNSSGEYAIRARVAEQAVELARLTVEPRAEIARTGKITHPVDYQLQAIHLIGYDLPIAKYRAGETMPVTLYWRADQIIAKNYVVFVHLLGTELNAVQNNFLWGQIDRAPRDGTYPTTAWRANETVTDPYRVPIATHAPPGTYKIEVGMYDVITGTRLKLSDGSDSVIVAEIEIVR